MESVLPMEVLSYILSYLDPQERLSAGLVSRRWLKASVSCMEDVCLIIRRQPLPLMTGRLYPRVTLDSTDIDVKCINFLNRLGPKLLHNLTACTVSTKKLVVSCLRLQTLVLEDDTHDQALLIFKTLPHLRELYLKDDNLRSAENLMTFDKIAGPNLKLFHVPHSVYAYSLMGISKQSKLALALEAFVARRAGTLTTLHFPKIITPQSVLRFSQIANLKLCGVSFVRCDNRVAGVFPQFFKHQPGIVTLNVDRIYSLNNQHLEKICRLLPELRHFSARQSFHSLDWGLHHLCRLRHLRKLSLTSCKLSLRALSESPFPTLELRSLDLSNTRVQDGSIRDLLSYTPLLEELILTDCSVADDTLACICNNLLPRLHSLSLKGSEQLSDVGLREIGKLPKIKRLNLSLCPLLTSNGVIESLCSLGHLRKLNLRNCPRVTLSIEAPLKKANPFLTLLLGPTDGFDLCPF